MNIKQASLPVFALLALTAVGCAADPAPAAEGEVAQAAETTGKPEVTKQCYTIGDVHSAGGAYHFCLGRQYQTYTKDVIGGGLGNVTVPVMDTCFITIRWSSDKPPPLRYWSTHIGFDCFDVPSTLTYVDTNMTSDGEIVIEHFDDIVEFLVDAASNGTAKPWDPTGEFSLDIWRWIIKPSDPVKIEAAK